MARIEKVTYSLTDDIDGAELGEVTEANNPFARVLVLGSAESGFRVYDLDLSDDNNAKMLTAKTQADNNIAAAKATAAKLIEDAERAAAELLEPFTGAGRLRKAEPVAKTGKRGAKKAAAPAGGKTAYEKEMEGHRRGWIRHWMGEHIADAPQQGRIPGDVTAAFDNNKDVAALLAWARANGKTIKSKPVSAPPAAPAFVPAQAAPVEEPAPAAPAAKSTRAKAGK